MYNPKDTRRPGQGGAGSPRRDNSCFNPPVQPISAMPIPDNFLDQAEKLMQTQELRITTSKIRRLYSMATEIYDEERLRTEETLSQENAAAVGMIRVRIAYECGRDRDVKAFVQRANLLAYLKGIGNSRTEFIKYTQYMEALVAYHKFFGGREN